MKVSSLEHNIKVHNKIAKKYESIHKEIYNEIEQKRLYESLKKALSFVNTESKDIVALDFGCGAGNLTKHLTDLNCNVIASDISKGFLDLVSSKSYKKPVTVKILNGVDLKGIEDSSVDFVAMYSVLHHVPDYLSLIKEFMRVLKKGGVLYIDHETSAGFWLNESNYKTFQKEIKKTSKIDFGKYLIPSNYIDRFIRLFINPKYQREGDIHVFEDDFIDWSFIKHEVSLNKGEVIAENHYLLYKLGYNKETFNKWKDKISDMSYLIARKQ